MSVSSLSTSSTGMRRDRPAEVLSWLKKMKVPSSKLPSLPELRAVCRGNFVPVWDFLMCHVHPEKHVATVQGNLQIYATDAPSEMKEALQQRLSLQEKVGASRDRLKRLRAEMRALREDLGSLDQKEASCELRAEEEQMRASLLETYSNKCRERILLVRELQSPVN